MAGNGCVCKMSVKIICGIKMAKLIGKGERKRGRRRGKGRKGCGEERKVGGAVWIKLGTS